ncbi:Tim10/DDP family zinc finger protein [Xylariaceae sp. FL0594]|nr:Tim10/DDP family zinc finger protein [Xylariaceae sp. FL0594]
MDNIQVSEASLEQLNDKDKAELRQFLQAENQRARMQATIHSLTDVCFNKCITGTIKSNKLDKGEETCLANCAARFFDISNLTMKHLQSMRS